MYNIAPASIFLSTLSLRRATFSVRFPRRYAHISIHALLTESDPWHRVVITSLHHFYPRSPCGERPFSLLAGLLVALYFYPRSPCGERRGLISLYSICSKFLSTLSLRRATAIGRRGRAARDNFYPRSPCGERRGRRRRPGPRENYFYPRSPCGERHGKLPKPLTDCVISIHALLAESDKINFCDSDPVTDISIHALLAESDS